MCVLKQSIPPYDKKPFHFVETGINVCSFEEMLFHCFHYWKESIDDFLQGRISIWIKDTLELTFISTQIDKIIAQDELLSERFLKFLALEGYFDDSELKELEYEIMMWENKSELDKLKQQGDERLYQEDYERAVFYYNKLLSYGESAVIYNNIGCCYMKMRMYSEAERNFILALDLDKRNYRIKLNIAMLNMLYNKSVGAEHILLELQKTDNGSEVQYYLGVLEMRRDRLKAAREYFIRSAQMGNIVDANTALCKIEMKAKNFNEAEEYLRKIPDKTCRQYLYNIARVNYEKGDINEAIVNIEKLLLTDYNKTGNWSFAAKLYCERGELVKAVEMAEKALALDAANEEAIFEYAKIKKAIGKPHEYQSLLKQITDKWKNKYKTAN